jgi:hypothetical protein
MADEPKLEDVVLTRLLHLDATIQAVVVGIITGLVIFVATNWLILEGGHIGPHGEPVIGPHLSLLSQFFVGYRVTFLGSLIGFAYGFVSGCLVGYSIARVYNWVVDLRERKGGHVSTR